MGAKPPPSRAYAAQRFGRALEAGPEEVREVLAEVFDSRGDQLLAMALLAEMAKFHKRWARITKWIFFGLGIFATLVVGAIVKVFS